MRATRRAIVALWTLAAMSTGAVMGANSQAVAEGNTRRVEAIVAERLTALGAPGAGVAVVHQGRIDLARGFGLASMEFGVGADRDTLFPLASVSKLFTGMAVLRLVEAGKFSLEDRIGRYVPDLPADWAQTPIKSLLNHTSGLPDFATTLEYDAAAFGNEMNSFSAAIALVLQRPREFPLGARWKYNQTGYALIGKLIETTSGRSFQDYVREAVMRPAGMSTAAYGGTTGPVVPRLSPTVYKKNADGSYSRHLINYPPANQAAAGLSVSAGDAARFLLYVDAQLQSGDRFLPLGWHERYRETVRFDELPPSEAHVVSSWKYGLGWVVLDQDGHMGVGHGGGGDFAWVALFPEERLGVAVMLNLAGDNALALLQDIARVYLPQQ